MCVAVVLSLFAASATAAISLDECVRAALSENPTLEAARRRVEAAGFAMGEARSGWYPRLHLSAGYTRTDNPPQVFMMALNQRRLDMMDPAFDPNEADDTGNVNLSAGADYLLYDGGMRAGGVRIAEKSAELSACRNRAAREALVFEVVRAWYQALQAEAFLKVRGETVASLLALLDAARERFEAGAVVRTDVLNLEVRLSEAREQSIRADNGLLLAIEALNTAIGREMVTPESLRAVRNDISPEPIETPPPDAYRRRPEWQEGVLRLDIAREAWENARSARGPQVRAFAAADFDSESARDFESSYRVGVSAEWEAFTGFEKSSRLRRANSEMLAAESVMTEIGNKLRLELRQANLNALNAWERIGVSESSVAGAAESLRITRERYRQGAVEVTELLMAQVAETAARTRALAARYEYCTALATLRRARGSLTGHYLDLPPRE